MLLVSLVSQKTKHVTLHFTFTKTKDVQIIYMMNIASKSLKKILTKYVIRNIHIVKSVQKVVIYR